ncbi:MAG: threonine--tRNA ligase, partial [Gemmatimonadaceae bacterium]
VKLAIGPPIDNGFYYDMELPRSLTDADLPEIEKRMRKIVARDPQFFQAPLARARALELFQAWQQPYKVELIEGIPDAEVSLYKQDRFIDLCAGPHVGRGGICGHFKLLSVAGAYWRGDEHRQMLQRIYGTAWFRKEDLEAYLHRIEEAKRRDHRLLGRQLDLFLFHQFSPGSVFWTERGTTIFNALVGYVRALQHENFQEVRTPALYNKGLWEISGHWGKYRDNMFLVFDNETKEHDTSLKPMNCPSHYLLYLARKHSYRELPLRFATFDTLHRNEVTGALSGLTRVRQFHQDDCHVFLTENQIADEVGFLAGLILAYYRTFGLTAAVRFATRPEVRIGDDALWDRAEAALRSALEATGMDYELKPGDGAFYGPKIDFDVTDSLGRLWQLGTIQLDYNAPERFDLEYVGEDNAMHRPVVIHRAVSGSFERFIAILIEHFAGAFPVWLAPEQVRVLPITDELTAVAQGVVRRMRDAGIRAHLDDRNETLNYRIRDGEVMKVPYMAVIGKREADADTVAVRVRGEGKKQEIVGVAEFVARVKGEAETRALAP